MMNFGQLPMQGNLNQMGLNIQIPNNQQLSAAGGVVPGTKSLGTAINQNPSLTRPP